MKPAEEYFMETCNLQYPLHTRTMSLSSLALAYTKVCVCVCVCAHVCLFVMKSWEKDESVGCYTRVKKKATSEAIK